MPNRIFISVAMCIIGGVLIRETYITSKDHSFQQGVCTVNDVILESHLFSELTPSSSVCGVNHTLCEPALSGFIEGKCCREEKSLMRGDASTDVRASRVNVGMCRRGSAMLIINNNSMVCPVSVDCSFLSNTSACFSKWLRNNIKNRSHVCHYQPDDPCGTVRVDRPGVNQVALSLGIICLIHGLIGLILVLRASRKATLEVDKMWDDLIDSVRVNAKPTRWKRQVAKDVAALRPSVTLTE